MKIANIFHSEKDIDIQKSVGYILKTTNKFGGKMINSRKLIRGILVIILFAVSCSSEKTTDLKSVEEIIAFRDRVNEQYKQETGKEKIWGSALDSGFVITGEKLIFSDNFSTLENWAHEGIGFLSQPEKGIMQINCVGSKQGGAGCMAFCRRDFPDSVVVEYEMRVLTTNGLVINFIACQGRNGEDMLTELPARKGVFADYVFSPVLRCYHVSISRYDDDGKHTGVSNWRRNPGLFLMGQQPDLCKIPNQWYRLKIVKAGKLLELFVNDTFAGGFVDNDEIPEPIPAEGKIGFRAIGREVIVQIKNFQVSRIVWNEQI